MTVRDFLRFFELTVLYGIVKLTMMVYSYTNAHHKVVEWSVVTVPLIVTVGVTWRCLTIFTPQLI
jgi:hypothetical protein